MLFSDSQKPSKVVQVLNEAVIVLKSLGVPIDGLTERRLARMAMAFLAVADVKSSAEWRQAKAWDGSRALKSREIIVYVNRHFEENISSGSYDDIRRKDLLLPVTAGIIQKSAENPNAARNDPTRAYALSPDYAEIIRQFGSPGWELTVAKFMAGRDSLAQILDARRKIEMIPIQLPSGKTLTFSPGAHNELQKRIIEEFLPRFAGGSDVLYVGDAADKFLLCETEKLKSLGFFDIGHGELPDVIAYSPAKNWLFLVEAVHTSGPMSPLRVANLKSLLKGCVAELVFVTGFLDRDTFRKFAPDIAWETEVWIADAPDHLIHFNGDKFLGPYKKPDR